MKKADFIIIGVVLAVAAVMLFFLYGVNRDSGEFVQIEIDGVVTQELPLNEDTVCELRTDNGSNTLVIKDGTAVMTEADCPDGICTNHMPIRRSGEAIICLPHKVVVSIVNTKSGDSEIDAVA